MPDYGHARTSGLTIDRVVAADVVLADGSIVRADAGTNPDLVPVYANDDAEAAVAALTPLLDLGPVLDTQAQLVPYAAIVAAQDARHYGGRGELLVSNGFAEHLTPELSDALADGLRSGVTSWIWIRSVGGAVNDVPTEETAYAHRHESFDVGSVGRREESFRAHWDEPRPHMDGLYISLETDPRPARLHDAYPGEALTWLRRLKHRYDSDNVFDGNFPIEPAARGRAAA